MNFARANPETIQAGSDFIKSVLPGVPAQNWAGAAGVATAYVYDRFTNSRGSSGGGKNY